MKPVGHGTTDGQRSCSSCRFFDAGQSWCWQFDSMTQPFQLSDGYMPKSPGPAQVFGPQQAPEPVLDEAPTEESVVDELPPEF